jgi:hypothetical protein
VSVCFSSLLTHSRSHSHSLSLRMSNPELVRGGGLLKYCNLRAQGYVSLLVLCALFGSKGVVGGLLPTSSCLGLTRGGRRQCRRAVTWCGWSCTCATAFSSTFRHRRPSASRSTTTLSSACDTRSGCLCLPVVGIAMRFRGNISGFRKSPRLTTAGDATARRAAESSRAAATVPARGPLWHRGHCGCHAPPPVACGAL